MVNTNINVSADLTDPAKELLTPPSKSAGQLLATIFDALHNSLLLSLQKYNIKMKVNLEKYEDDLRKNLGKIPQEQIVDPSINLWGKTFESLKWNLDDEQEYIRNAFKNILLADIDKRTKTKVKTSFVEIVNQLDKNDAELLKDIIKPYSTINIYERQVSIKTKETETPTEYFVVEEFFDLDGIKELMALNVDLKASLNNIERLGLIKIVMNYRWGNQKRVNKYSNNGGWIRDDTANLSTKQDIALKGRLEVTDFGKMFLEICFKD